MGEWAQGLRHDGCDAHLGGPRAREERKGQRDRREIGAVRDALEVIVFCDPNDLYGGGLKWEWNDQVHVVAGLSAMNFPTFGCEWTTGIRCRREVGIGADSA